MSKSMKENMELIESVFGPYSEVYKEGVAIDDNNQYVADIVIHDLRNGMKEYHLSIYPFNENKRLDSISLMKVHESDIVDHDNLIAKAKYRFDEWVKNENS